MGNYLKFITFYLQMLHLLTTDFQQKILNRRFLKNVFLQLEMFHGLLSLNTLFWFISLICSVDFTVSSNFSSCSILASHTNNSSCFFLLNFNLLFHTYHFQAVSKRVLCCHIIYLFILLLLFGFIVFVLAENMG